jgi:hypothetical protein
MSEMEIGQSMGFESRKRMAQVAGTFGPEIGLMIQSSLFLFMVSI